MISSPIFFAEKMSENPSSKGKNNNFQ